MNDLDQPNKEPSLDFISISFESDAEFSVTIDGIEYVVKPGETFTLPNPEKIQGENNDPKSV